MLVGNVVRDERQTITQPPEPRSCRLAEIELLQSDIYLKQNQQFAENETVKQKKVVLEGEVLTLQSENAVKRAEIEQVRLKIELLKKIAEVKAQ